MLQEVLSERPIPGKHAETGTEAKFPQAEDIFTWASSNPKMMTDSPKIKDEADFWRGRPSNFGGSWGGDGNMVRYVELNPILNGKPASIVVPENSIQEGNIIRVRRKEVKARVLLGELNGEFGLRYSLTEDGKWYRESGKLKIYEKDPSDSRTTQELLDKMQEVLDKYRVDEKSRPTAELMLDELRGKLDEENGQDIAWIRRGGYREVADVLSRNHIEDIVRREGSVYTKKRA